MLAKLTARRAAANQCQLHEEKAPEVLRTLMELRGIFIKAGQYLVVRPEITPEPYRRAFKKLQTDAPCEPRAPLDRARRLGVTLPRVTGTCGTSSDGRSFPETRLARPQ